MAGRKQAPVITQDIRLLRNRKKFLAAELKIVHRKIRKLDKEERRIAAMLNETERSYNSAMAKAEFDATGKFTHVVPTHKRNTRAKRPPRLHSPVYKPQVQRWTPSDQSETRRELAAELEASAHSVTHLTIPEDEPLGS